MWMLWVISHIAQIIHASFHVLEVDKSALKLLCCFYIEQTSAVFNFICSVSIAFAGLITPLPFLFLMVKVVLAANDLPSINDVTYPELFDIILKVKVYN